MHVRIAACGVGLLLRRRCSRLAGGAALCGASFIASTSCCRPSAPLIAEARASTALVDASDAQRGGASSALVRAAASWWRQCLWVPVVIGRSLGRIVWLGFVLTPPLVVLGLRTLIGGDTLERTFDAALLAALHRGGACLMKLGQWASTRPDLLPTSLCITLSQLHDRVPPHSAAATDAAIESAFGASTGTLFAHFEYAPVGSGCIAQVHEARLADSSRTRVAVKVRHPRVDETIDLDLRLLRAAARAVGTFGALRWLSLADAADEFSEFMHAQLDLTVEARRDTRAGYAREMCARGWRSPPTEVASTAPPNPAGGESRYFPRELRGCGRRGR